jgi:cbb3-type cytochrome oxidase maturation protein
LFFLAAFLWAVKKGQYDDTVTPAIRMLFETPSHPSQTSNQPAQPTPSAQSPSHTV